MAVTTDRAPELDPRSEGSTPLGGPVVKVSRRPWYLRPPRLVVVATATFAVLTAFWSVFTPLAEAPDEPAHLGLVLHVAETGRYPTHDGLHHTAGMFQICLDHATTAKWCRNAEERAADVKVRDRPADAAPPKDERPHWDDPGFRSSAPGRLNQMPQHPPLYYGVMAAALRVERAVVPGGLSIDRELALLRMLNVLVVLPIPWLAWCLARRLGLGDDVGTVAAVVPLTVPQLTHIGSTLNNDNLFVVLVSALMVLLAGVARGDRSRRTAVLVGLTTGLALLTKGFGIVLPPVVSLAYWIGSAAPGTKAHRSGGWQRVRGRAGLGALAVGFVVCGWWYVAKLIATGHIMPSIEDARLDGSERPAGLQPELGEYVGTTVSRLVEGFWGAFGWRAVKLPTAISLATTLLCLVAGAAAFRHRARMRADDEPVGRATLVMLLVPLALLTVFVVVRSAVIYHEAGVLAFQQGRYLFAGLTGAAVVVAIGARHLLGQRTLAVAVGGVLLMQGLAIAWCLRSWWGADGTVLLESLRAVVAWSGWPDIVVIAILALTPLQLALLATLALPLLGKQNRAERGFAFQERSAGR
jgi:small subunit ribosomal protein S36